MIADLVPAAALPRRATIAAPTIAVRVKVQDREQETIAAPTIAVPDRIQVPDPVQAVAMIADPTTATQVRIPVPAPAPDPATIDGPIREPRRLAAAAAPLLRQRDAATSVGRILAREAPPLAAATIAVTIRADREARGCAIGATAAAADRRATGAAAATTAAGWIDGVRQVRSAAVLQAVSAAVAAASGASTVAADRAAVLAFPAVAVGGRTLECTTASLRRNEAAAPSAAVPDRDGDRDSACTSASGRRNAASAAGIVGRLQDREPAASIRATEAGGIRRRATIVGRRRLHSATTVGRRPRRNGVETTGDRCRRGRALRAVPDLPRGEALAAPARPCLAPAIWRRNWIV
jgi:hypothetical protein